MYALIHGNHPELAGKIVGIILEDKENKPCEIDFLIANPLSLKAMVKEALEVLKNYATQSAAVVTSAFPPPAIKVTLHDDAVDYEWQSEDDAPLVVAPGGATTAPPHQLDQALATARPSRDVPGGSLVSAISDIAATTESARSDDGVDDEGFVSVRRKGKRRTLAKRDPEPSGKAMSS